MAGGFCKKHNMKLYDRKSSAESSSVLTEFVKTLFRNNSKAKVQVKGRKGKKCPTISGSGKLGFLWYTSSCTFVCEFVDPKTSKKILQKKNKPVMTLFLSISEVNDRQ